MFHYYVKLVILAWTYYESVLGKMVQYLIEEKFENAIKESITK